MADLKINYQEAKNLGNNVSSKSEEFGSLLSKIKSANEELKTYWEGSDASKYSDKVSEQAQTMDKLNTTLSDIGTFLVNVGNAYEKVSQENQNSIN
jgi:WXG100 family type VII secretion target